MSLTRDEQETIIIFNEADPIATLSTTSTLVISRLSKAGYQGTMDGPTFTCQIPKDIVRLRGKGWKSLRLAGITSFVSKEYEQNKDGTINA